MGFYFLYFVVCGVFFLFLGGCMFILFFFLWPTRHQDGNFRKRKSWSTQWLIRKQHAVHKHLKRWDVWLLGHPLASCFSLMNISALFNCDIFECVTFLCMCVCVCVCTNCTFYGVKPAQSFKVWVFAELIPLNIVQLLWQLSYGIVVIL